MAAAARPAGPESRRSPGLLLLLASTSSSAVSSCSRGVLVCSGGGLLRRCDTEPPARAGTFPSCRDCSQDHRHHPLERRTGLFVKYQPTGNTQTLRASVCGAGRNAGCPHAAEASPAWSEDLQAGAHGVRAAPGYVCRPRRVV